MEADFPRGKQSFSASFTAHFELRIHCIRNWDGHIAKRPFALIIKPQESLMGRFSNCLMHIAQKISK